MLKKILLIFNFIFWLSLSASNIVSCSNIKENPYIIDLKNKINNNNSLVVKLSYQSPSLNNPQIINNIEDDLQLNNYEKSLITKISAPNNTLIENNLTNVEFDINVSNYKNIILHKNVIFYNKDQSNLKNSKIFQLYNYNNKFFAIASNGEINNLYMGDDLYVFSKIYIDDDTSLSINCINFQFGYYVIGTNKGIYKTNDDFKTVQKLNFTNYITLNNISINYVTFIGFYIYICTDDGLYYYDIFNPYNKLTKILNYTVYKVFLINSNIFVSTNNGIYLSTDKTNFVKIDNSSFKNNTGDVILNDIIEFQMYKKFYLLLSTNNGLYACNLQNSIEKYYLLSSLGNINVFCTSIIKNILYIGTENGLYRSYDYFDNFYLDNIINQISVTSINNFNSDSNTGYVLTNAINNDELINSINGMIYISV